jgi:CIC family chloride channel protein
MSWSRLHRWRPTRLSSADLGLGSRRVLLLAGITGALTGLAVAAFEWLTREQLFNRLHRQPEAVQLCGPVVGLLLAAGCLRWIAHSPSPATADEYIRNFHEPGRRLDLRPLTGRILASLATLGLGGALGYEGPSIYLGAGIGSALQGRLSRYFSREATKVLLVAGAAAGVAAIFKAPATGLVFALEVPYQDDFARRMILPAGMSAAVSYLVFAAFTGTAPLLAVRGTPPFNLRDLGGAALLGVVCGLGARGFTRALTGAKQIAGRINPWARALGAGAGLAALAALSYQLFGSGLTLGAGYDNLTWAVDPRRAVALVVALLVMRAVATVLTVGGGGAGGLFIPLVIEGALVGRTFGGLFRTAASGSNFFPLIGISAFLGAGYRVPLAAVVFTAEASGRPGFIVPGLIAAIVAQLFMGTASASSYQRAARAGHLEHRFTLPLSAALQTDVATAPPSTTLAEFFWHHAVGLRAQAVAVVEDGHYRGVIRVEDLATTPQNQWDTRLVVDLMHTDLPTADLRWQLSDAMRAMERADIDFLPVVDDQARFVGVVTTSEILELDEILRLTGEEEP